MRRLACFLPLLLLLGCSGGDDDMKMVGSTAPEITVDTLARPATAVSLSKKRGKVVLMDFWATWCGPCRQISPTLEAFYAKYKDQGLDAMAITTEAQEIVARNEQIRPHTMPVYLDTSEKASLAFGVTGLPTIMVIDREGHIAYRTSGVGPDTESEIDSAIQAALRKS